MAVETQHSRPGSTHPQLNLPLSHHGLPRTPISPDSGISILSINRQSTAPRSSTPDSLNLKSTRFSIVPPPLSPPMTPFSPSAFPSQVQSPALTLETEPCHHCSCCIRRQVQRTRSLEDLPRSPRHEKSTRSLATPPEDQLRHEMEKEAEEMVRKSEESQRSSSSSSFARFGKKIKSALGPKKQQNTGDLERRQSSRRRIEIEEMEDVHWTEM